MSALVFRFLGLAGSDRMLTRRVALVGLLVLAGCGSSDNEAGTVAGTRASTTLPGALPGSYARTLTEDDIEAVGASLAGPPDGLPVGETRLTIEPDGTAFVVHADRGDETNQGRLHLGSARGDGW